MGRFASLVVEEEKGLTEGLKGPGARRSLDFGTNNTPGEEKWLLQDLDE